MEWGCLCEWGVVVSCLRARPDKALVSSRMSYTLHVSLQTILPDLH